VKRAIAKHAGHFGAVIGLVAVAALVGGYILHNQRMRFPWEGRTFQLQAAFSTAQAVTPGQGQTVRVSGVRIGDVSGVTLSEGRAIVTMDVDSQYKGLVHTDATALLRPKTGLKDMFIELNPGTKSAPVAKPGYTIPVRNTLPDINAEGAYLRTDGQVFAPKNSAFVGVKAEWSIWEWGASNALRRAAVADAAAARRDLEATERQIESDLAISLAQGDSARGAVDAAEKAIASAEEAFRVTQAQLKAGAATTTDLLQAESELTQARLNLTRAQYELALAHVAVKRASGV